MSEKRLFSHWLMVALVALALFLVATAAAAGTARVRWKVDFDGSTSAPVLAEGVAYVGSFDGAVYAFDAATGRQIWKFQTGERLTSGPEMIQAPRGQELSAAMEAAGRAKQVGKREISATPVVAAGAVYIGSEDHTFYSLDAATGELTWSRATGGRILDSAVIAEGIVYFVSLDGGLYALDARDGSDRWVLQTAPPEARWPRKPHPPVLTESSLFTSVWAGAGRESRGVLIAVDPRTGESRWRLTVDGGGVTRPTLAEDSLLFTIYRIDDRGTTLYSVDAATGDIRWRFEAPPVGFAQNTAALTVGSAVVFANSATVFKVDLETGRELWRFEAPGNYRRMLADGRSVYLSANPTNRRGARPLIAPAKRNRVHALDIATGAERWSARSHHSLSPVLLHGALLIVARGGGMLLALDTSTGRQIWSRSLPSVSHAAPLVHGSLVLVATLPDIRMGMRPMRGKLLCLETAVP